MSDCGMLGLRITATISDGAEGVSGSNAMPVGLMSVLARNTALAQAEPDKFICSTSESKRMIKLISLYLFSLHGIIVWDNYYTYDGCMADKHYLEAKFAYLREENRYLIGECLELGKTTQEFLEQEEVLDND
jgi:hypothetical protein